MIRPQRCSSTRKRSVVWTLRSREKNDLVLATALSSCKGVWDIEARIGVRLVPQEAEHAPAILLADELNRVHAATQGLARVLVAARLVHAPDLSDVAEAVDRVRDL